MWVGASMHWGHGVPHESLVYRRGLNVWGYDDCMFSEVKLEGISSPASFGLHDVEKDPMQEVFKCRPDPDSVPLQWPKAGHSRCASYSFQEFWLGERASGVQSLVGE